MKVKTKREEYGINEKGKGKKTGQPPKMRANTAHLATIRVKLILSFLVPIVFIIILGVVSFVRAANGLRSSYEKSTQQVINMTADNIGLSMESVESLSLQYMSDNIKQDFFMQLFDYDTHLKDRNLRIITSDIKDKVATDRYISQITLTSAEDTITTLQSLKDQLYNGFLSTEQGKKVKSSKDALWFGSDTYLDDALGVSAGQYAMRLVRSFKGADALIIMDMDYQTIKTVLDNVGFDKSGTLALVTADGKEIVVGKDQNATKAIFSDKEFYQKAEKSDKNHAASYVSYNKESNLFIYSKIGNSGAMICAIVPKSTILKQADKIKDITIFIVILACILAVLIGFFISYGIDKTIRSIIKKLKQAAAGDLTVDFTTKRKDEFRVLIDEINHTFSNMKELIRQVKTLSDEVSKASNNVSQTSEEFYKTSSSISSAMNEIEQGVMQQAKDAEECLLQMDNLSAKIEQMNTSANEIEKIAEDTKTNVQAGTVVTRELTSQTLQTIEISTEIVKRIEELAEKSISIGSIINVINEISNQTNLLSLNASIEAARAGEVGKGFGVVASEIRNLAEQTRCSVNDIKSIIEGIQEDTENVVKTAKSAEHVMTLQDNAVKNTAQSYLAINNSVDLLTDNLKRIIENVANIEGARASTLGAIENISAVLEETAASTNNVNQISGNQLKSIEDLNQSAGNLNQDSQHLVQAIQKFSV